MSGLPLGDKKWSSPTPSALARRPPGPYPDRVEADRLDDGRVHRRDLTGTMTGAAILFPLGALVGLLMPGVGDMRGAAAGALLGAVTGAMLGRAFIRRHLSADDFEPERGPAPTWARARPTRTADRTRAAGNRRTAARDRCGPARAPAGSGGWRRPGAPRAGADRRGWPTETGNPPVARPGRWRPGPPVRRRDPGPTDGHGPVQGNHRGRALVEQLIVKCHDPWPVGGHQLAAEACLAAMAACRWNSVR